MNDQPHSHGHQPHSISAGSREQWDVVVIGGGPAGLAAALMLGRARRRVLVVDSDQPRNRFATHMHGVLGYEGAEPALLARQGRAEASGYGVEFTSGTAIGVEEIPGGLSVVLREARTCRARAVIVATGLADRLPEIPDLAERWGRSVLHCPYCHGWEVRDQRLGVLTTSALGWHQAQLVRQWSDHLAVFTAGLGEPEEQTERRLLARGIELVASEVVEVLGEGDRLTGVRTAEGDVIELDALFVAADPLPHDGFLAGLELARSDTPWGSFLTVDETGRTSNRRIWAAGNVTNPALSVPMAIGAGTAVGAAVNFALVTEDFDLALARQWPEIAPVDYWEERYTGTERVWSGRVNQALSEVAADLTPGRALDLGCGEGADVIWLAGQGWDATGVDISPTAITRGTAAAAASGLSSRTRFLAMDAADPGALPDGEHYDLITASFLHSLVTLPRTEILRRAAERIVPGGHLLVTSHAAPPPWADLAHHEHRFLTADEEVTELGLPAEQWEVLIAETRSRRAAGPDGQPATLDDTVVLLRRR
jgi:thioredoxin reductase/SAM-dependent methyltransferase